MVGMMFWGNAQEQEWRKGPWMPEEDKLLSDYVNTHGEGRWSCVAKTAGLNRSGKSCRLRWVNYLRPGLNKGQITPQEEGIIIELHALWGNKWSTIARYLPGRTDNEIKNYWRTHFKIKKKDMIVRTSSRRQERKETQSMQEQKQQQNQQVPDQAQDDHDKLKNSPSENIACNEKIMDEATATQLDMALVGPTSAAAATATATTTTALEHHDQQSCLHHHHHHHLMMMYQDVITSSIISDAMMVADQDIVLGGLWNLDDPYDNRMENQ